MLTLLLPEGGEFFRYFCLDTPSLPYASELHLVFQRLALREVPDVLQGGGGDVAQRLLREVGLVGGDDDVVERQQTGQRVVVDDLVRAVFVEVLALFLVDVQSGRAYLLVLQPFDEGVGVDQLSAAGVDDQWISCPRPVLMIITPSFILLME